MIDISQYAMSFDLDVAAGRAQATARLEKLEHDCKVMQDALAEYKSILLEWMDEKGHKVLEAGNRTWKNQTRETARIDKRKVESFCQDMGKDVDELKTVQTSHYFQLCK